MDNNHEIISHISIKSKYVNTVELYFGDKVDKDFLAYIRDYKNLNVNVVKEVGEMKEYNITFCYSGVNYQVPMCLINIQPVAT